MKNINYPTKSGLQKKKYTLDPLFHLVNSIGKGFEWSRVTIAIFFPLKRFTVLSGGNVLY